LEDYSLKALRQQFKAKGVFYTPKEQAELIKSFIDIEGYTEVYDPTCGRGNLLSVYGDDIAKYGQDIDEDAVNDARKRLTNFTGYVGDVLQDDCFKDKQFDVIVANPPFSIRYEQTESLKSDDRFKNLPCLPNESKADYLFIYHCLAKLKSTGVAIIINFPGILYRKAKEGILRKYLVDMNYIEKVVTIPPNTFTDTNIMTVILILKKNRTTNEILFVNTEDNVSRLVSIDEIIQNDYNLSVTTYVQKEEIKEIIDAVSLQNDAQKALLADLKGSLMMTKLACYFEKLDYLGYLVEILELVQNEISDFKLNGYENIF